MTPSMKAGQRVTVATDTGEQAEAVITEVSFHTDMIDVTIGGVTPGGPPPDRYRKFMPGKTTCTVTLELDPS